MDPLFNDEDTRAMCAALGDYELTNVNVGITAPAAYEEDADFADFQSGPLRSNTITFTLPHVDARDWQRDHVLTGRHPRTGEEIQFRISDPPEDLRDGFITIRCVRA